MALHNRGQQMAILSKMTVLTKEEDAWAEALTNVAAAFSQRTLGISTHLSAFTRCSKCFFNRQKLLINLTDIWAISIIYTKAVELLFRKKSPKFFRGLCGSKKDTSRFLNPNLADSSTMVFLKNLIPPTEGVRHEQLDTAVEVDGQKLGSGTLFVAET